MGMLGRKGIEVTPDVSVTPVVLPIPTFWVSEMSVQPDFAACQICICCCCCCCCCNKMLNKSHLWKEELILFRGVKSIMVGRHGYSSRMCNLHPSCPLV